MITPAEIAKQLIAAERERVAIAPFTDANPELDVATACLAQRAFVQAKLDAGERVVGAELGLTSKVKQQAMGVDAPLWGVVTSGMLSPFGVPIELSEFIHPRVEPEIAFVLARDARPRRRYRACWRPPSRCTGLSMSWTRATRASGSRCPTSSPTTRALRDSL